MLRQRHAVMSHGLPRNALTAGLLLMVVLLEPPAARAQASEPAHTAAEVLFEEGRRLMEEGQYSAACAKFRESQRLDSGSGTLMNLGRCYTKQGRTASAWATYRQAAALARAGGQHDRERVARREIVALELQLAKARISVPPEVRALRPTLTLDGAELAVELWDVVMPVDPGEHELTIVAPDRIASSLRFHAAPSEIETVRVPALSALPARPTVTDSTRREWSFQHSAAVVAAGVGVTALALGAFWTVAAHADYDAGREFCEDEVRCHAEGVTLREDAIAQAKLAQLSFVVAGTALAGGTVLWLTAPPLAASSRPNAGPAGRATWSIGVSGRW
jgi:serine/threonine-protein kinase